MIKKVFLCLISFILMQSLCFAKDKLQFDFPNDGWHKVASPDGVESKKCYVPYNQTGENYTEMLIFSERILKTQELSPVVIMQKQLGKDRNNYQDITPEYISHDLNDAMVTWCSQIKNTCVIQRAFKGEEGIILVTYMNKSPHYSQNMFGQWSNILSNIKVYSPESGEKTPDNLIELD
ncbi:MAG: hypothetical protein LUH11_03580 [Candidatus Gastranaerophilales bacterium]|nr:hypothetical protein [Candidatus Gastranaerophilales bacterium]